MFSYFFFFNAKINISIKMIIMHSIYQSSASWKIFIQLCLGSVYLVAPKKNHTHAYTARLLGCIRLEVYKLINLEVYK